MGEAKIEAYLKKRVEALGGMCLKFTSPSRRGVSDRICVSALGFVYFVETKFGKNGLSPAQKLFKKEMAERNIEVYVLATKEEIDRFIDEIYL